MKTTNPHSYGLAVFGSKWTFSVAAALRGRVVRFGALRLEQGNISQKTLSSSLKLLEQQGLVVRRQYATIPPRVEYSLTRMGEEVMARLVPLSDLMGEGTTKASPSS